MKSRRYFLKQGALASAAMLVAKPFTSYAARNSFFSFNTGKGNQITLLHTNDLHNHLQPLTHNNFHQLGGFEKTAGMIFKLKEEQDNVILLDAGDIFCGNIQHLKEHKETLQIMRSAGYDAVLLGNRDYEGGTDYLQEQWQNTEIPLVASNYSFKNGWLKNAHVPYKIIQKGNIKIGIIGAGLNMKKITSTQVNEDVQFIDPIKELTAIATMLKQEKKCQLVICISHLGYKNKKTIDDITLASQSKNIDVIIGGHSHTFMQAPHIVLNQQQQEVIINHAGYGGMVLGNMNIFFDDYGNKSKVVFNNLMIGTTNNQWAHQKASAAVMSI
jgi:5'-nucleotidase